MRYLLNTNPSERDLEFFCRSLLNSLLQRRHEGEPIVLEQEYDAEAIGADLPGNSLPSQTPGFVDYRIEGSKTSIYVGRPARIRREQP